MLQPIRLEVRQRLAIPIVEVQASSKLKIEALMDFMMKIYDYAEKLGGRLIPMNEGNKTAKENAIYYTVIFKNNKEATQFVEYLKNYY